MRCLRRLRLSPERRALLAVTVLTSMDADELRSVGVDSPPLDQVHRLAQTAASARSTVSCALRLRRARSKRLWVRTAF